VAHRRGDADTIRRPACRRKNAVSVQRGPPPETVLNLFSGLRGSRHTYKLSRVPYIKHTHTHNPRVDGIPTMLFRWQRSVVGHPPDCSGQTPNKVRLLGIVIERVTTDGRLRVFPWRVGARDDHGIYAPKGGGHGTLRASSGRCRVGIGAAIVEAAATRCPVSAPARSVTGQFGKLESAGLS
jgi:hypothetical protein